jgi:hypothetical protein
MGEAKIASRFRSDIDRIQGAGAMNIRYREKGKANC